MNEESDPAPSPLDAIPTELGGHPDLYSPVRKKKDKVESIERIYTYRKPDPEATLNYTRLRVQCKNLAYLLHEILQANPQQKRAMESLETTFMWAQASIAFAQTGTEMQ